MAEQEAAVDAAAKVFERPTKDVFAQDVTAEYPWVRQHRIFLAKEFVEYRCLLVSVRGGATTVFGRASSLPSLNALFEREGILLPEGLPPEKLALTVRSFLRDPLGFVATRAFLERARRDLEAGFKGPKGECAAILEKHCQDPTLERRHDGWTLQFFFFNGLGGFEHWRVDGKLRAIRDVTPRSVVPDRTFDFLFG